MYSRCWPTFSAALELDFLGGEDEALPKSFASLCGVPREGLRKLLCSFRVPVKEVDTLKWLEDFEEEADIHPEVPDYLAALHACEVTRQPLERIWTLLMDMRKKGLELEKSITDAKHLHFLEHLSVWETLERHCKMWLLDSKPHPRARAAVLRIGGLLKHKGISSADAVVRLALTPLLEALAEQPMRGLGAFTQEALRPAVFLEAFCLNEVFGHHE